ncbi:MAG: hypothetical protein ACFCD0_11590 [Gemmataceae bacterium]
MFQSWEGFVTQEKIDATRRTFQHLLDRLIGLGVQASHDDVVKQFELCVEALNQLDLKDQFICTIEREELCEQLYNNGQECGMPEDEDLVDGHLPLGLFFQGVFFCFGQYLRADRAFIDGLTRMALPPLTELNEEEIGSFADSLIPQEPSFE